jgi:DNA polymerase-1
LLRLLFDTESNGFVANATKVHCIGITDVDTGEYTGYRPDQLAQGLARLADAEVLIGHNILRHDIPLLKKLHKIQLRPGVKLKDTMVISRLIFPNLKASDKNLIDAGKMPPGNKYKGKHSIGAWGYRLGAPKGDYAQIREAEARALGLDDPKAIAEFVWGTFNEDMFAYMAQDVATNFALWKHCNPDQYPQKPIDLEHRIARVCDAMNIAGVPFDLPAAGELQAELTGRKHEIEVKLKERYGFWFAPTSPDPTKAIFIPKKANKEAGYWGDEWTTEEPDPKRPGKTKTKKHFKGYACTKLKEVEFNPGSSDHLAKVLTDQGWKPTKFTEGGKPAMDEEVIESIANQFPEMDGLAELLMINKRLSQLVGGKSSKYPLIDSVQEDGCIHGVINPMGTITSRAAHMFPNLGQVPSAKKPYGKAFRALFTKHVPSVYKGSAFPTKVGKLLPWKFLGADQAGLELRGLAHYLFPLDGGKYMKVVIEGDPHWMHVNAMGLADGRA